MHIQGTSANHAAHIAALQTSRPAAAPKPAPAPAAKTDADGDHDGDKGRNVDARA